MSSGASFGGGLKNADGSRYYDAAQDWDENGRLGSGDTFTGTRNSEMLMKGLSGAADMAGAYGGGQVAPPPTATAGGGFEAGNQGPLQGIPLEYIFPLLELVNRTRR